MHNKLLFLSVLFMVPLWLSAAEPNSVVMDIFNGKDLPQWPLAVWQLESTTNITEQTDGSRVAKKIEFDGFAVAYFQNQKTKDLSAFLPDGVLKFDLKILKDAPYLIEFRIDCVHPCVGQVYFKDLPPVGIWKEVEIPLIDFAKAGTDFKKINTPFLITGPTDTPLSVLVANIRWERPAQVSRNQTIVDAAEKLLAQMTLDEKIGQMTLIERQSLGPNDENILKFRLGALLSGGGSWPEPNTPESWANMIDGFQKKALSGRLKIPLLYGVDAVHGHNNVQGATIFPHNLGLGASRNAELVKKIGKATALEMVATGANWTFSPCLCVVRDDRWGRTYESFGEHPELASMMTSLISGYQGTDFDDHSLALQRPETVLATAKHWVADGNTTLGVDQGNTDLQEKELREVHIAPYIPAIRRGVGSVMVSHSSFQRQRMHGHNYLNNKVLKNELGFSGFLVTDWEGTNKLPEKNYGAQISRAINAGVDMIMVPHQVEVFQKALRGEILGGRIPLSRIDDAVKRILIKKFELNLFKSPWARREWLTQVGSPAHRNLAQQAVRESLVLLKNEATASGQKLLPLPKSGRVLYVAGKSAHNLGNQAGGWTITWQGQSGFKPFKGTTILEGIQAQVSEETEVIYSEQAELPMDSSQVGIVVVGETPYAEGIGDRQDLHLSSSDQQVINKVCGTLDCVVVLVSGRPLLLTEKLSQIKALVAAWLPGSEGAGVAQVLFGDYDFVGKLPLSWPKSMAQQPINIGDHPYEPLFPYGFGLRLHE